MIITNRKDAKKFSSIPIMKYVLENNLDAINCLVESDSTVVDFVHQNSGDSPLLLAARYKHHQSLKLLIDRQADIEHRNIDGKRALHEAALSGCLYCTQHLIEQNANTDALKRADWTPLMCASTKGHLHIMRELIQHGKADVRRVNKDGWNCFHLSCREGCVEALEYFLQIDDRLWDTYSNNLRTPLHTACMHGQLPTIMFLFEKCNYVNDRKDSCGTTPLMDAVRFGHVEAVRYLVGKSCDDTHTCDNLGRYPIHIGAHSGQLVTVKYLIDERNVNINAKCCTSSTTSLHLAAKEGHIEVVDYILNNGGDVDSTDSSGRTALHLSSAANRVNIVSHIIRHGADVGIIDGNGKTACEYAMSDAVRYLFSSTEK